MIQIISIVATTPPQKGDIKKAHTKQIQKYKKDLENQKSPMFFNIIKGRLFPGRPLLPHPPTTKTDSTPPPPIPRKSLLRWDPWDPWAENHLFLRSPPTNPSHFSPLKMVGTGGFTKGQVVGKVTDSGGRYGGCCCFFFVCVFLVVVWKHKKILGLDIIDFGGNVMKSYILIGLNTYIISSH